MAFQPVETVSRRDAMASISYRRAKTSKGVTITPRLIIGIPKQIFDGLKQKKGQMFGLLIGTGPDAGKGRIQPVDAGGIEPRLIKGGATFRFGYVPMLGDDQAEKEFIVAKVIGGGVTAAVSSSSSRPGSRPTSRCRLHSNANRRLR